MAVLQIQKEHMWSTVLKSIVREPIRQYNWFKEFQEPHRNRGGLLIQKQIYSEMQDTPTHRSVIN